MTRLITALFILGALAPIGDAMARQEAASRELTLDDALELARTESFAVRLAAADADNARAGKMRSMAAFLPSVSLSEQGVTTTDPLTAFGFGLKQETVTMADFDPARLNDPDRTTNYSTRVDVRQPLINVDAFYERRAASAGARAAEKVVEHTQAWMNVRVREAYYGLVLADRRIEVLDSALVSARSNLSRIRDLHEQGLINRADLLGAEVRVLEVEAQTAEARAGRERAEGQLKTILGLVDDAVVIATDPLTAPSNTSARVSSRLGARADLQALSLRHDAAQARAAADRARYIPRLNVFGAYEWNSADLFGTDASNWQGGFALTWDLFSGMDNAGRARQSRLAAHRVDIELEEQTLKARTELNAAVHAVQAASSRVDQMERAVEQARESLRIRSDRFDQGLESADDLLAAEILLSRQRLSLLQARYDYLIGLHRIDFLSGTQEDADVASAQTALK